MSTTQDPSDSEEEILIYAEFDENVNLSKYKSIHLLGVNEKNPVLQMNEAFFTGKYQPALGTYMFFEEGHSPVSNDTLFDKAEEKNLTYVTKTRKVIKMDHAFATQIKIPESDDVKTENESTEDDIKPITFNSLAEAIEKFRNEFDLSFSEKKDTQGHTVSTSSSKTVPESES